VQFLHNKGATAATISFALATAATISFALATAATISFALATSLSHQCKSIAFSITSLVLQDLQVNVFVGSVVDISII
jgi:hypothetical protein